MAAFVESVLECCASFNALQDFGQRVNKVETKSNPVQWWLYSMKFVALNLQDNLSL